MKYAITILILSFYLSLMANYEDDSKEKNNAPATATYTGKVIDSKTGESLTGVKIKIVELGIDTYTDFDGNFMFTGNTNRKYTISASYISYKEKKMTASNKPVNVSLDAVDN